MDLNFNNPAIYMIKVQGELGDEWSGRLGGMQITVERKEGVKPVSVLTGHLKDQSALSGVLNTLFDMHLPLLLVELLKDE